MSEEAKPKPVCESDLRILLHDVLEIGPKEFDSYFQVIEEKDQLLLKCIKYFEEKTFRAILELVRSWGGNYEPAPRKEFVIPILKKPEPQHEGPRSIPLPGGESIPIVKQEPTVTTRTPITEAEHFQFIAMDKILNMPFQSRISEDPEFGELVESIKTYGVLEPILVRPKPSELFEVVGGERRFKAAQKAGLTEIPAIVKVLSDEEALVIQLTENFQRKDLTDEEKSRALGELARRTKWNAQQIADKLKMSERWVYKYLPGEFKGPEPEQLASARRALQQPQYINCEVCGVATSSPIHFEEKFYCDRHVPQPSSATVSPTVERQIAEQPQTPESAPSEPKPEPVDVAEFTCNVCHQDFRIVHVANNLHRFVPVKKVSE